MLAYVIYIIIFLFIVNRHALNLFKKVLKEKSRDPKVLQILSKKLHLSLPYFWIYDTKMFWGMMVGIPGKPQMVLSSIYKDMNNNELEWLLLHEAGHYKLVHSIRDLLHQLIVICMGIFLIDLVHIPFSQYVLAIILGIFFGILSIQTAKLFEYEAEKFAISRMENPQGAIDAANRSKKTWKNADISKRLFNRWDPSMYDKRIALARKEIEKRKHAIIPK